MNHLKKCMNHLKIYVYTCLLLLLPSVVKAQSKLEKLVGVSASVGVPHGLRLDAGVAITPSLAVRAGVSGIPTIQLLSNHALPLGSNPEYKEALGYDPELRASLKAGSLQGELMLDWHPFDSGFRLTVGAFFSGLKATGMVRLIDPKTGKSIMESSKNGSLDPNNMPKLKFQLVDDAGNNIKGEFVEFQPSRDASFEVSLGFTKPFQPYFGIGYGYAVPRDRVSFMFDLGLVHTGKVQLTSPNAIAGDPNILFKLKKEATLVRHYFQFLPVFNLGIAVRIY